MPNQLSIANVVTVSVVNPPAGLLAYNINNLCIFTKETPVASIPAGYAIYLDAASVGTDWGTSSEVYSQAQNIFAQTPNILTGGGKLIIYKQQSGDTLAVVADQAVTLSGLFFGGFLVAGYTPIDAEYIAAATWAQTNNKLLFASNHLAAALTNGTGVFDAIRDASQDKARMFLYTAGGTALAARIAVAAYAGRAMSTDFSGSNTTSTMHMKDLVNVVPDTGISQTILDSALSTGVDCYCSFGGGGQTLGKVFSSGVRGFFDDVYNVLWLRYALEVAGFNAIAQTAYKLPQTENGVATLKGAYIDVLNVGVRNGFLAPGSWTSADTFGNPADLRRNVLEQGYYIYSLPVVQQAQVDRAARKAPVIQIAVKFAGAIHSTNVIVNVNA